MTKQDKKTSEIQDILRDDWKADIDAEPMSLGEAINKLGIGLEVRKPEDMKDKPFLLMEAKEIPTSYTQEHDPYFVTCHDEKTGREFGMVLGGAQPCQIIKSYIAAKPITPLRAQLKWNTGGSEDGYWTLVDPKV